MQVPPPPESSVYPALCAAACAQPLGLAVFGEESVGVITASSGQQRTLWLTASCSSSQPGGSGVRGVQRGWAGPRIFLGLSSVSVRACLPPRPTRFPRLHRCVTPSKSEAFFRIVTAPS